MNTEYQQEEEIISLTELFSLLKRYFLKIAGAGLVCAILGFTVTQFMIKPVYEARAKMIVNTRQNQTGTVTNDQINSAKNLVRKLQFQIEHSLVGLIERVPGYRRLSNYISC